MKTIKRDFPLLLVFLLLDCFSIALARHFKFLMKLKLFHTPTTSHLDNLDEFNDAIQRRRIERKLFTCNRDDFKLDFINFLKRGKNNG